MADEYPKDRPKFFAMRVIRKMLKDCVAQQIGGLACQIITAVVCTEDAINYRRPVTFYDGQLMPILGVSTPKALRLARRKAIEAGWLKYTPGHKGKASVYWVEVPKDLNSVDDFPMDEAHDDTDSRSLGTQNGPTKGLQKDLETEDSRSVGTVKGHHSGLQRDTQRAPIGTLKGHTSFPSTYSSTDSDPQEESFSPQSANTEDSAHRPNKLGKTPSNKEFDTFWMAYPRKVGKGKAIAAFDSAARKVAKATGVPMASAYNWIVAAAEEFAASPAGNAGAFVPYPATWLNQGRYDDDRAEWQQRRESKPDDDDKPPVGRPLRKDELPYHRVGMTEFIRPAHMEPLTKTGYTKFENELFEEHRKKNPNCYITQTVPRNEFHPEPLPPYTIYRDGP